MNLKGFLTSMLLIIGGAIWLSEDFPPALESIKNIGWIPLVFGLIWISVAVKQELIH